MAATDPLGNVSTSDDIRPTSVLKYESMTSNRTPIADAHRNHSTIIILPSINLTTIFEAENNHSLSTTMSHKKIIQTLRPTPVASSTHTMQTSTASMSHVAIKRDASFNSMGHLKHEHRKRVDVTISIVIHNISVTLDDFNDAENRNERPVHNGTRFVYFAHSIVSSFYSPFRLTPFFSVMRWGRFDSNETAVSTATMPSANHTINQTEIIYSVLVNGNAVLAVIAAGDMNLMSDSEASHELNRTVYIKAERK